MIAALLLAAACSADAPLALRVRDAGVAVGSRFRVEVEVPGRPQAPAAGAVFGDFLLAAAPPAVASGDGWTQPLDLVPLAGGALEIPPIELDVGGRALRTAAQPIEVATRLDAGDRELRESLALEPLPAPIPWAAILLAAAGALAVLGLVTMARRPMRAAPATPAAPSILDRLRALAARTERDEKALFAAALLLREHLSSRWHAGAQAMTADEMAARLETAPLRELFRLEEAAKYARRAVDPVQVEAALASAVACVEDEG